MTHDIRLALEALAFYAIEANWKNDSVDIGVGNQEIPESSEVAQDQGRRAREVYEALCRAPCDDAEFGMSDPVAIGSDEGVREALAELLVVVDALKPRATPGGEAYKIIKRRLEAVTEKASAALRAAPPPAMGDGWKVDAATVEACAKAVEAGYTSSYSMYAKSRQEAAQAIRAMLATAPVPSALQSKEDRNAVIEECAKVAEGPLVKEHYRGNEFANWSIDGSSPYGNGRLDAAKAIRALKDSQP